VSFSADYFESLSKCKKIKIIIIIKLKNQFSKETNEGFIGSNSFLNSKHTKISP
jgi:hypothetical protein